MTRHALAISSARCLVAAFLLWSLLAPAVRAQAQPAPPADWPFTWLIENVVSPPRGFTGTDG